MYGVIDYSRLSTVPGANSPFAPPEGWAGDYLQLMRERFRNDVGFRQQAYFAASNFKKSDTVAIEGEYADALRTILKAL